MSELLVFIHIHMYGKEHSLARIAENERNGRSRIVIFANRETERTNCITVGICVHENAEEQNEARYFGEDPGTRVKFSLVES